MLAGSGQSLLQFGLAEIGPHIGQFGPSSVDIAQHGAKLGQAGQSREQLGLNYSAGTRAAGERHGRGV